MELEVGCLEAFEPSESRLDQLVAVVVGHEVGPLFPWILRSDKKPYLIEPRLAQQLSCEVYVPVVDGIERATKDARAYVHAFRKSLTIR